MGRVTLYRVEEDLDPSAVYARAQEARSSYDTKMCEVVDLRDERRRAEQNLGDHEIELASAYRANNPDLSQAQFDKQVKWVVNQDATWRELREKVNELTNRLESAEADASVLKRDVQIGFGRMLSLAGELFFRGADRLVVEDGI